MGLVDMKSVVKNEADKDDEAHKANEEAYFTALKEVFGDLDIPLDTAEPKIKALISDGASVRGALPWLTC